MIEVDNIILDGASDALSQGNSTNKLGNHAQETDLGHRQAAGGHRGGVRVGDIVGSITETTTAKGDSSNSEDPIVLVEGGHGVIDYKTRPRAERPSFL
jgi:hypothetical protein